MTGNTPTPRQDDDWCDECEAWFPEQIHEHVLGRDRSAVAVVASRVRVANVVNSGLRGKEARRRANDPGRDTGGSAPMPAKRTPKPPLFRTPESWARDWGWINRKQADELRDALRACMSYIESDIEGVDFVPPELENARRVLAKRVHRYPKGRKS